MPREAQTSMLYRHASLQLFVDLCGKEYYRRSALCSVILWYMFACLKMNRDMSIRRGKPQKACRRAQTAHVRSDTRASLGIPLAYLPLTPCGMRRPSESFLRSACSLQFHTLQRSSGPSQPYHRIARISEDTPPHTRLRTQR